MTNVLPKDGEVLYFPNLYTEEQSKMFMDILTQKVRWQQDRIKMFGKEHNIPRLTSWYGEGGLPYYYSGIKMVPNKIDFDELSLIKMAVELQTENRFNSVLLNLYRDGQDSVSRHSDDEKELGTNPIIASLTFGSTRVFKFRHKQDNKLQREIELTPGSLVIMKGETQHMWEHSVPKTSKVIGPRINLTFRVIGGS